MNYLHLGKGTVVPTAGIVGIFDLDVTSQSHLTRRFLREAPPVFVIKRREQKEVW